MKKLIVIMVLLSTNLFAGDALNSYANKNCAQLSDPKEKHECLNREKRTEAEEHFKNFEENTRNPYQKDF